MKVLDFLSLRRLLLPLSALLVTVALISLATRGLSYGLDFTGGLSVELEFDRPASLSQVRQRLQQVGVEGAQVSYFGSERLIVVRTAPNIVVDDRPATAEETTATVLAALNSPQTGTATLRRSEAVGPRIGDELREQGGLAMLVALLALLLYVAFRFQLKFAAAAVVALTHDVLIVLGIFSLFGLDLDLAVLTAVLALIGYSLNDTIVVSDRMRENFRRLKGQEPVSVMNISLTQTLSRTLATSATTLAVLLSLLFFGGGALFGFSLALTLGVVVGTYSSLYIVTSVLLLLRISSDDLALPSREEDSVS